MSRAKDIFERLRSQGLTALDALIADREPESLFLDFKRSPDDGSARVLSEEDGKNLSKAVSGFANSSGGVIVWGVDCRRDASGNENASKMPVVDAHGFNTKLQGAVSRSSIPPHPGVEIIAIQGEDPTSSRGFVVLTPTEI
ncbi:MAG: ATP-binding protein [Burkholderiales bacterium]|nr:MAG: ATP-binding protein [Burkholderiales bacterium]